MSQASGQRQPATGVRGTPRHTEPGCCGRCQREREARTRHRPASRRPPPSGGGGYGVSPRIKKRSQAVAGGANASAKRERGTVPPAGDRRQVAAGGAGVPPASKKGARLLRAVPTRARSANEAPSRQPATAAKWRRGARGFPPHQKKEPGCCGRCQREREARTRHRPASRRPPPSGGGGRGGSPRIKKRSQAVAGGANASAKRERGTVPPAGDRRQVAAGGAGVPPASKKGARLLRAVPTRARSANEAPSRQPATAAKWRRGA